MQYQGSAQSAQPDAYLQPLRALADEIFFAMECGAAIALIGLSNVWQSSKASAATMANIVQQIIAHPPGLCISLPCAGRWGR